MKEHGILFSGEMVKALLAGTKTQTRRVIHPQPELTPQGVWVWPPAHKAEIPKAAWGENIADPTTMPKHAPYQKGDLLWGRELFWIDQRNAKPLTQVQELFYAATPEWARDHLGKLVRARYLGNELVSREDSDLNLQQSKFWGRRPSIHMPRWASRIQREVINVRVQRIQDISDEDCMAEGVGQFLNASAVGVPMTKPRGETLCRVAFRDLWDSLHCPSEDDWEGNPWVWAYTLKEAA